MLTVERLGKRYGPRWLFRELDLELGTGDRLLVLGRNGSGKSTLLRILADLAEPTEGVVRRNGRPSLAGLEMAVYPALTAAEHLKLAADLRGCASAVDALLAKVGLAGARDLPAGRMSTGMKARLKLALAIQPAPPILLLDEPGASLDEEGRSVVEAICEEQAARGCLVIATNDPRERRLANLEIQLDD